MERIEEINQLLMRQVDEKHTPSVQYLFFDGNQIIHQFYSGFADVLTHKKTTDKTSYNVYSVTKTFTALAVLQLAERNKLDVDQPVIKYLPQFPYTPDITIRQILAHSSGIPNPVPLNWIHLASEHRLFDRNKFFGPIFKKHNKSKTKPNEKYTYSNLGYVLLGQLIETVSGVQYEDYVRDNILNPLYITSDEMDFVISGFSNHAKGYHRSLSFTGLMLGLFINKSKFMGKTEGGWKPFNDLYINGTPYGGLIGNPNALLKYIRDLLRPESKLICDEYKQMLFTENLTNNGYLTGMCLSWFKGQLKGETYFTHAGGGGGYYCEIRIYPGQGVGSLIMFNRSGFSDERFLDKVDKYFIN